jgi:hypothetical protein
MRSRPDTRKPDERPRAYVENAATVDGGSRVVDTSLRPAFPPGMTRTTSPSLAVFPVLAALGALVACSSNPPPPPAGVEQLTLTPIKPVAEAAPSEVPDAGPAAASALDASPPATATKTCTTSKDCGKSEICAGEAGCDKTWTCKPSPPCTRDLVTYCGCDGKTFQTSGSCPGQKYKSRGGC